jgi:hypothetical protein
VLPSVTIETLNDGEVVQAGASDGTLLLADLAGFGLTAPDRFFAGIAVTQPFDALRITLDAGLIGLNTSIDIYYACASAPAAGSFPGLPLPAP